MVTIIGFSWVLTEGSIGLEEEGIPVECSSADIATSTVALVVWAAAVVVAAAGNCSKKESSLVNELAAAELAKVRTTVELEAVSSS